MLDARYVNARRHLLQNAAVELLSALDEAGVPSMLIKGEATAQALYEPAEPRLMQDVDVVIQSGDLARADPVLKALGYVPAITQARAHEVARHARTWTRGRGQAVVEIDLHTSFHGVTAAPEVLWNCWWGEARSITIGHDGVSGTVVAAPSLATTALIVAVHRNRSTDGSAAVRDLDLAVDLLAMDVWRAAAAQARLLGCESTMAAGLLRHPEGAELLQGLGIDTEITRREALYRDRGDAFAIGWYEWWHTADRRARARRLVEELWPSAEILARLYPYALRGSGWMALAHLHRIAELIRHAPRGLLQAFGPRSRR